jgi:hypothetical protein
MPLARTASSAFLKPFFNPFSNLVTPFFAHLVKLGTPSANKILPPAALPQPNLSK